MPPPSKPRTSRSFDFSPPPSHFSHRVALLRACEVTLISYLRTIFHRPAHIHIHSIRYATHTLTHETSIFRSHPPPHFHPPNQLYFLTRALTHCLDFLTLLPIPPSTDATPPFFRHHAFAPVALQTIRAVSAFAHLRDPTLVPRTLRAFAHFIIAAAIFAPRRPWSQSMYAIAPKVAPALLVTLQLAPPAQRALLADAISPLLSLLCHFLQHAPYTAGVYLPVTDRLQAAETFVSAIEMVLCVLPVERRRALLARLRELREAAVDAVGAEARLCRDLDAVMQRVERLDG